MRVPPAPELAGPARAVGGGASAERIVVQLHVAQLQNPSRLASLSKETQREYWRIPKINHDSCRRPETPTRSRVGGGGPSKLEEKK